ncbi:MAG: patatin-like phospholipase family protein [Pseudomonadota bacterium]
MKIERRAAALGLMLLTLASCASQPRTPIPEEAIALSAPYNIPGTLRSWGDTLGDRSLAAVRAELTARTAATHAGAITTGTRASETLLALSGGGADGAFGAGVLAGWSERGDRPVFDVVSGVSTGAIIGLFAFLGPDYDAVLREFYTAYSTEDLLEPAPFSALTGGAALSDTRAYNGLIERYIDDAVVAALAAESERGRTLLIGTTNLDAARPVIWNVTNIARTRHPEAITLIRDLIRASSAIPAVFPPVVIPSVAPGGEVFDELHVDGGATQQVMVFSPELSIREIDTALGLKIDRTLYVMVNNALEKVYDPVDLGVLSIAGKAISSLIGGSSTGDLYKIFAITERDGVELRILAVPKSFDLEPREAFDTTYMRALYDLGRAIGQEGAHWASEPPNFVRATSQGSKNNAAARP